jgi:Domain of unknown function (DUF4404)
MDTDALRDQLMKLHEELGVARRIDPRSQQLLGEIMEDIKRLMAQDSAATDTGRNPVPGQPAAVSSLPDRLEKIAVQFEADHPTLAASSRRLVDLLGKVGL